MTLMRKLIGFTAATLLVILLLVEVYRARGGLVMTEAILGIIVMCAVGWASARALTKRGGHLDAGHDIAVQASSNPVHPSVNPGSGLAQQGAGHVGEARSPLDAASAAHGIKIRTLISESKRREAYNLMRSQITDPSFMEYFPARNVVIAGRRIEDPAMTILAALDENRNVVGAAYFGPEWNVIIQNQISGISFQQSMAAYETVKILHGIATIPSARGKGLGRLLLRAVEENVLSAGSIALAGVADTHEIDFYKRCGYQPLGQDVALLMKSPVKLGMASLTIALPISGSSQWFAKALMGEGAVGGCCLKEHRKTQEFMLTQGNLTTVVDC